MDDHYKSPYGPVRSSISRAMFLRYMGAGALGLTAAGALAACGGGDSTTAATTAAGTAATTGADVTAEAAALGGTLAFLGWQGYDDATAAAPVIEAGVTISPEYITTNDDIVTKLRGGGVGSIDVVTPFIGYIPALVAGGLIEELDLSRVPSTQNFYKEFVDLSNEFGGGAPTSVPLVWGDTPMIVIEDQMPELPESWLDLRDPKYKGTLLTLDDIYGNIVIMSRALFGPDNANMITQAQLDDVVKVWKEIKPNLVSITPSFGDAADIMARGDAGGMIQGWRFMEVEIKKKGIEAMGHMPSEGSYSWCDTFAIAKDAPNLDASYAFIEQMVSPEGNALVAAATGCGVCNMEARANLPEDQAGLYPYDDIATYLTVDTGFYALPLEPEGDAVSYDEWIKAWEEIKSA